MLTHSCRSSSDIFQFLATTRTKRTMMIVFGVETPPEDFSVAMTAQKCSMTLGEPGERHCRAVRTEFRVLVDEERERLTTNRLLQPQLAGGAPERRSPLAVPVVRQRCRKSLAVHSAARHQRSLQCRIDRPPATRGCLQRPARRRAGSPREVEGASI